MKTRYRLIDSDGRFVTQTGQKPFLTSFASIAYNWDSQADAEKIRPAYSQALNTPLTVQPYLCSSN